MEMARPSAPDCRLGRLLAQPAPRATQLPRPLSAAAGSGILARSRQRERERWLTPREGSWMEIGSGSGRPIGTRPRQQARLVPAADLLRQPPQFFATASVECPYVPGRAERKLIVELTGFQAADFYD